MTINIDMPEIDEIIKMLSELLKAIGQIPGSGAQGDGIEKKLWYRREDLAKLKGMPISAFYNKPWLLPGPPLKQGGVEAWSYKQVFESGWIWMSDEDLKQNAAARAGFNLLTPARAI
ncbi:hypothetical protein KA005_14080 [bacterium]|nr:hypothetical protein [bacterium]